MSNLNLQKLSELCTLYSGGTPSTSNESYWNGNLNWMSSGETSNKLIYGTKLKISEKGVAESSTRLAHSGDTVVATAGEGKTRGQTSYLLTDTYVNQSIVVLEADKTKIDNKFLFYAVSNSYNRMRALSDAAGIRGSLPCKLLNNFEINTFNLDIENKIGQFLFNIDLKIENNNKINAELESLAKTIYDYWFLQFEFPNEEGKPYKSSGGKMVWNEELKREIPEGWEVIYLKDLFSFVKGKNPSNLSQSKTENCNSPYITIDVANLGEPSFCNPQDMIMCHEDVIMVMDGAASGDIYIGCKGVLGSTFSLLKIKNDIVKKEELYMTLLSLKPIYKKCNKGSTVPHANKEFIEQIAVPFPKKRTFDSKLEQIFKRIFELRHENQNLSSLRDFLLPMLMNGQISFSDDI